jgi:SMC interacting uncharacterized protein involved in chromosome segregation
MKKTNSWFLAVVLVCTLGMWGCNSQKNGAFNAKIREMEARYAKLEDDFRSVTASAEQTRKKITQAEARRVEAEEKVAELSRRVEELQTAVQERDELRKQVQTRTAERDAYQGQLMQFSRDLQALAGRIETAANAGANPSAGVTTAIPTSRPSE